MLFRTLILTCSVLLWSSLVFAQEENGGNFPLSPELQEQIDGIEHITERLRGLPQLEPVPVDFPTEEEVQTFLYEEVISYYTEERIAEDMAFYVAFDFLTPDYDLPGGLLNLYTEQVGGFYLPETSTMNVILLSGNQPGDRLPLLERIIYAHEYVHALQDQHFDLSTYEEQVENDSNDDRALALQSLVEGDAAAIQNEYTRRSAEANPLGTVIELGSGMLQSNSLTTFPPGTPDILGETLLFPYMSGEQFVAYLYKEGGWDLVNQAYDNPPQSTEHILHPETYLNGEEPITVTIPDQSAVLGENWVLARSGVLGEYHLREWLQTQLGSMQGMAADAAAGWGGDAYRIYRNTDQTYAWRMSIVWDTPEDARQFIDLFEEWAQLRLRNGVEEGLGFYRCWAANTMICMRLDDAVMTDIIFAPDYDTAQILIGDE